jgi:hypothetical protein
MLLITCAALTPQVESDVKFAVPLGYYQAIKLNTVPTQTAQPVNRLSTTHRQSWPLQTTSSELITISPARLRRTSRRRQTPAWSATGLFSTAVQARPCHRTTRASRRCTRRRRRLCCESKSSTSGRGRDHRRRLLGSRLRPHKALLSQRVQIHRLPVRKARITTPALSRISYRPCRRRRRRCLPYSVSSCRRAAARSSPQPLLCYLTPLHFTRVLAPRLRRCHKHAVSSRRKPRTSVPIRMPPQRRMSNRQRAMSGIAIAWGPRWASTAAPAASPRSRTRRQHRRQWREHARCRLDACKHMRRCSRHLRHPHPRAHPTKIHPSGSSPPALQVRTVAPICHTRRQVQFTCLLSSHVTCAAVLPLHP